MKHRDPNPDPQELLPETMRRRWFVLPRWMGYQIFFAGLIIGAGLALSIYGLARDDKTVLPAFPVSLFVSWLLNRLTDRRERMDMDALRSSTKQK